MPWPPRTQPIACGLAARDRGDVQAQLEAGPAPRHPHDAVAEALGGQPLAVGRGGQRDARVGVQVVDVRPRSATRAWRCRSTARRRPCRAGSSRTPRPSRPRARRRGRRRPARAAGPGAARPARPAVERAEVAAGALDPQQLDGLGRHRVGLRALGRGVAAGVVGVAGIGAEPVRARDHLGPRCCVSVMIVLRVVIGGSGAPAGLLAADALGDDALGVAGRGRRRPSGRGRGRGRCAAGPAAAGRRCCRRPSARRARRARHRRAGRRPSASWSTSSTLAVASCTFITERIWPGILGSMLWHWSSMKEICGVGGEAAAGVDLEQDPEQLERVGRADDEVVVGVEAGVEVEGAELPGPQQERDDELDVGARRVVAGVDAHLRPLAQLQAVRERRAPVGHVHRVERRLEQLVLEDQPLVARRAARRPSAAPRPAGPAGRGCCPGPGSWCRRRTRASDRASRSGP